jgi:hypothetical protein
MSERFDDSDELFDPGQCRAARGQLQISVEELAVKAGYPVEEINAYEAGRRRPFPWNSQPDEIERAKSARKLAEAIRRVLEGEGVDIIPEAGGNGTGVRLRRSTKGRFDRWGR